MKGGEFPASFSIGNTAPIRSFVIASCRYTLQSTLYTKKRNNFNFLELQSIATIFISLFSFLHDVKWS
jgi:hypothetical protein